MISENIVYFFFHFRTLLRFFFPPLLKLHVYLFIHFSACPFSPAARDRFLLFTVFPPFFPSGVLARFAHLFPFSNAKIASSFPGPHPEFAHLGFPRRSTAGHARGSPLTYTFLAVFFFRVFLGKMTLIRFQSIYSDTNLPFLSYGKVPSSSVPLTELTSLPLCIFLSFIFVEMNCS